MRYDLIALPELNQKPDVEFTLVWALPQLIFSAVEALQVLSSSESSLGPRTQIYGKVIRKWEQFRDDSAHYAIRLFQVSSASHDFRIPIESFAGSAVQGFSYDYDSDMLSVGGRSEQSMNLVDALDALRAIFRELKRKLDRNEKRFPQDSVRDYNIDRTITYYEKELDHNIDEFTEYDVWFDARRSDRVKQIKERLKKGGQSEEQLHIALALPRSILKRILGEMVRDKAVIGTRSGNEWHFTLSRSRSNSRGRRPPLNET